MVEKLHGITARGLLALVWLVSLDFRVDSGQRSWCPETTHLGVTCLMACFLVPARAASSLKSKPQEQELRLQFRLLVCHNMQWGFAACGWAGEGDNKSPKNGFLIGPTNSSRACSSACNSSLHSHIPARVCSHVFGFLE